MNINLVTKLDQHMHKQIEFILALGNHFSGESETLRIVYTRTLKKRGFLARPILCSKRLSRVSEVFLKKFLKKKPTTIHDDECICFMHVDFRGHVGHQESEHD